MLIRTLRNFPYSRDGVTSLSAMVGDEIDMPDALVEGLVREGWVEKAKARKVVAPEPPPEPAVELAQIAPPEAAITSAPEAVTVAADAARLAEETSQLAAATADAAPEAASAKAK